MFFVRKPIYKKPKWRKKNYKLTIFCKSVNKSCFFTEIIQIILKVEIVFSVVFNK